LHSAFSPDGSGVVLASDVGGDYEIWKINSSGNGGAAQLTFNDGTVDTNPDWGRVAANAAPVAVNDSKTVTEDDPATSIDVLANDTDVDGGTKEIASTSNGPSHGTVTVAANRLGLSYKPDANYCGPDSFAYTLNGGSTATVSITVSCVEDPPVVSPSPSPVGPIFGTPGTDVIQGTPGNDVIYGLGGNDKIYGNGGDDLIVGGKGNDKLFGLDGNDTLKGGAGVDKCVGGIGKDVAKKCEKVHTVP
jgi:Ca2+-binding RTX toxin-like protein